MTASPRSFSSMKRRRPRQSSYGGVRTRKSTQATKSTFQRPYAVKNGSQNKSQRGSSNKVARHPAFNRPTLAQTPQANAKVISHPAFNPNPKENPSQKTAEKPSTPGKLFQGWFINPTVPKQSPFWLRVLFRIQTGSSIITGLLVTGVLLVYASTVYVQQEWTQEYRRLEQLQREHRNLIAADEALKHQLANQASQSDAGYVSPSPDNTIFLPRSTQEPVVQENSTQAATNHRAVNVNAPLGY